MTVMLQHCCMSDSEVLLLSKEAISDVNLAAVASLHF